MRIPSAQVLSRRLVLMLPALALQPATRPAVADRVTAQTVGIDSDSLLGIVWGGRERCDPTQTTCSKGGVSAVASAVQPVPNVEQLVTDRVALNITVSGVPAGRITLGLWRDAAPVSVDTFVRLARGTMRNEDDEEPASLIGSGTVRVQRDRAVVLGALTRPGGSTSIVPGRARPVRTPVQPPSNKDLNQLSHSTAGLLSMPRGGGSFQFTLTPRANAALDRENIVIGQVIDQEGMEVLERLNALATNNYDQNALAVVKVSHISLQ